MPWISTCRRNKEVDADDIEFEDKCIPLVYINVHVNRSIHTQVGVAPAVYFIYSYSLDKSHLIVPIYSYSLTSY